LFKGLHACVGFANTSVFFSVGDVHGDWYLPVQVVQQWRLSANGVDRIKDDYVFRIAPVLC